MSNYASTLTATAKIKRNTQYVVDPVVIDGLTVSVDRQPIQSSRFEVEVQGSVVTNGLVTIAGIGVGEVVERVIADRSLATKWALTVQSGQLNITETTETDQGEPVIEDLNSPGTFFKLFIDQGMPQIETTTQVAGISVLQGGSIQEQILFGANECMAGEQDFTVVSSITISGFVGGTISMWAVNKFGQPINQQYTLDNNANVRFFPIRKGELGKFKVKVGGKEKDVKYKMLASGTQNLRVGDIVYPLTGIVGMTMAEIGSIEGIWDFNGLTHHIESDLVDL